MNAQSMFAKHTGLVLRLAPVLVAFLCVSSVATAQVFTDGYESGDTALWDTTIGIPIPEAFRFTDLDLRDPHLFFGIGPLCFDVTDTGAAGFASFNEGIQDSITMDSDMDGLLDLSVLLLFRPLDTAAVDGGLDQADGLCTAPMVSTVCDPDPTTPSGLEHYASADAGVCLDTIAGTTSGYAPPVDVPAGPCFTTAPRDAMVSLGGIEVMLREAQVAATFEGDPVASLTSGLLRGFLTEADANSIVLPADLGGGTLASLLPGGAGNCANDDGTGLDDLDGVAGWWFYLNYDAVRVPYTGP